MARTRKSAVSLISSFALFIEWISLLLKEVKKLGGNEESIYKFFSDKEKIAETAKLILQDDSRAGDTLAPAILGEKRFFAGNDYLKLLYGKKELILDAQDGLRLISEQKNLFVYIDHNFARYGESEKRETTEKQKVQAYELIKDSDFSNFFNSVGVALDKLCLTQAQIIDFLCKHKDWLCDNGYTTFFLFKSDSKFFVATVYCEDSGTLQAYARSLGNYTMWRTADRCLIVIPQVELS
jgi:hypothetical protein